MHENQSNHGLSGSSDAALQGSLPIQESLSALMDGEAQPLEMQRVLKQCGEDDVLRATWARYQLASALIHRQAVDNTTVSLAFADRVQQALQQEATPATPRRRGLAKLAVAASVAIAVVGAVQWPQLTGVAPQQAMVAKQATPVVAPSLPQEHTGSVQEKSLAPVFLASQPVNRNTQLQQVRFERYMQYHLERASLNDGRGMVPLSRNVSAEER